ncbi:sugar kinase [Geomonas silvestris]|uniref:Sugar kinase n=1 Tax=Geomonas silvestris TaxID=2740184 RepID=A0A6V8MHG0_9BACT|nr:ROK family protein [Geomonas silvestris]GFO59431.1 sugar kinase [Geomonas silvestris]
MAGRDLETLCLGVDLGGTNLRCALVAEDGVIVERHSLATDIGSGREAFLDRLVAHLLELKHGAQKRGRQVSAAGLGVPGLFSNDGVLRSSVNLVALEGVNLAQEVARRVGVPTIALNDANASAVGEQRYGAGRPFASSLMVTLGTGVGAGLILDGRLWTGIDGVAAEFGHVTVEPEGRRCGCGNRGCLEQYASASAIAALAAEANVAPLSGRLDAAAVAARARQGCPKALGVYRRAGSYLGIALASVVNLLNLEAVVLGGGVAESFGLLAEALHREIRERAFPIPAERVRVLKGVLGDDAGILGAAATAYAVAAARPAPR